MSEPSAAPEAKPPRAWSARIGAIVLLIGVIVCAIWLWRAASRGQLVFRPSPGLVVALILSWTAMVLCSTSLWRLLLARVAGIAVSWTEGVTHTGTLLVGKYVPGGVFGLLGRGLQLRAHGRDREVVAVTLIEQWLVLHAGASLVALLWLWRYSPVVALIAAAIVMIAGRVALGALGAIVAWLSERWPRWSRWVEPLRLAGAIGAKDYANGFARQGLVWVLFAIFALLCASLNGIALDVELALGIARAFCLSVVVGTLAIFAPGGIGVREFTFAALAAEMLGGATRAGELVLLIRVVGALGDLATGAVAASMLLRAGAARR